MLAEGKVLDRVRHIDNVWVEVVSHGVRSDVECTRHAIDPEAAVDDAAAGSDLLRPKTSQLWPSPRPSSRLLRVSFAVSVVIRCLGLCIGDGLNLVQSLEHVRGYVLGGPHAVIRLKLELRRLHEREVLARGFFGCRRLLRRLD